MGICSSCCRRSQRNDLYEPLLLDDEREAVTSLLRYLEHSRGNPSSASPRPGLVRGRTSVECDPLSKLEKKEKKNLFSFSLPTAESI